MLNLCVIGAGEHSRRCHLPALAAFRERNNYVTLSAVCDLDPARADESARAFGFARSFTDPDAMLSACKPDACLVITPVTATAEISMRMIRAGCPVLIEKPLGSTIEEARAFGMAVAPHPVSAMVSMNRRFDPMTVAAINWIGKRPITKIRAAMRRECRIEADFVTATGLHLVDVVSSIGGKVAHYENRAEWTNGAWWWSIRLVFANGIEALVDIQPTFGRDEEWLRISGDDFQAEARSAEFDTGQWQGWLEGKPAAEGNVSGLLPFEANGTYAETAAFIEAARMKQPMRPSPAEVIASMELCHAARMQTMPDTAMP